jgi:hypothetical protein
MVYCGADCTERDYFEGFREKLRQGNVSVRIRYEGIDPARLVRLAASYRDQRPGRFDEVWCIVDVDQFDMDAAVAEARRLDVRLAISNPCFELWLLLHRGDCRAFCNDCNEVERRLRRHVPAYDKTRLNFADFVGGVHDAVKRAKDLDAAGTDHRRNPSTNVWQLVERILEGT